MASKAEKVFSAMLGDRCMYHAGSHGRFAHDPAVGSCTSPKYNGTWRVCRSCLEWTRGLNRPDIAIVED